MMQDDLKVQFTQFIEEKMGLHFEEADLKSLEPKLSKAAKEFGFSTISDWAKWLIKKDLNENEITLLASFLTIGETYFFRDEGSFKALETYILPQIIKRKEKEGKEIKIWCVGCCTGEEPYSIAIMLDQLLPNFSEWNIRISGSDINSVFLKKAEKGVYKEWSFRTTPKSIKNAYFTSSDNGYKIRDSIKKVVNFFYFNLADQHFFSLLSNQDLILCNNVLIYFSKEKIKQAIKNLKDSLSEDGWLLVSAHEAPFITDKELIAHTIHHATFFAKKQHAKNESHQIKKEPTQKKPKQLLQTLIKTSLPKQENLEEPDLIAYFNLGDYQSVIEILEPKLNPYARKKKLGSDMKMAHLLAKSLANFGAAEKAKLVTDLILAEDKLDPHLHFFRASLFQEMGQIDDAINSLRQALFLNPNFLLAYYVLGNQLLKQGKEEEAEKNFKNALQIIPTLNPKSLVDQGEGLTVDQLKNMIHLRFSRRGFS